MQSKELYLKTNPYKLFFMTAVPGAISMLASMLYGIFDGIFVGQLLGDTAFAAVNLAFPFVIINFSISDLIAVGSAVPISIALGKHEDEKANNIFTSASLLIIITGAVLGVVMYIFSPMLLGLMGAEGELKNLATDYVRVYAVTSPLTTMTFAMDNYLRISGRIKTSMFLNIALSVFTVALEFVFLFVFRFGIWGAALASCLSMMLVVLVSVYPFARGRLQLKYRKPKFTKAMLLQIATCGVPTFLNNIAGRITSIIMNVALLSLGGVEAVAIYGILMYIGESIQPIVYGVCDSLQPAIGYNYGAKQYDRVKKLTVCIFVAAFAVSVGGAALMFFCPDILVPLFTTNTEPSFLAEAILALEIYASSKLLQWFSMAAQSYLTAIEKPAMAGIISVCTALIFPVLALFAFYPLGLTGLWLNATVTMALSFVLSLLLLIISARHKMKNA